MKALKTYLTKRNLEKPFQSDEIQTLCDLIDANGFCVKPVFEISISDPGEKFDFQDFKKVSQIIHLLWTKF